MQQKMFEFSEEVQRAHHEAQSWKDVVHRMEREANEMKKLVDELEFKNKRLNDRVFEQINERAVTYKERTMQVLQTSHRPMQASEFSQTAEPTIRPDLGRLDRRKSGSPLRDKSNGKTIPEKSLPSYHIRDELKNSG